MGIGTVDHSICWFKSASCSLVHGLQITFSKKLQKNINIKKPLLIYGLNNTVNHDVDELSPWSPKRQVSIYYVYIL